jgi:hypothetical protein
MTYSNLNWQKIMEKKGSEEDRNTFCENFNCLLENQKLNTTLEIVETTSQKVNQSKVFNESTFKDRVFTDSTTEAISVV